MLIRRGGFLYFCLLLSRKSGAEDAQPQVCAADGTASLLNQELEEGEREEADEEGEYEDGEDKAVTARRTLRSWCRCSTSLQNTRRDRAGRSLGLPRSPKCGNLRLF